MDRKRKNPPSPEQSPESAFDAAAAAAADSPDELDLGLEYALVDEEGIRQAGLIMDNMIDDPQQHQVLQTIREDTDAQYPGSIPPGMPSTATGAVSSQTPSTPGLTPSYSQSSAATPTLAAGTPSPLPWKQIIPNWMGPANNSPTPRPKPWHGRETARGTIINVSARDATPRDGLEYLEQIRALCPTVHQLLRLARGQAYPLQLDRKYSEIHDDLSQEYLNLKNIAASINPQAVHPEDLPDIKQEDWTNYIEDWDVAGKSGDIQRRVLSNWDNLAREAWKEQQVPLRFSNECFKIVDSVLYVDANLQLTRRALPKCVTVMMDDDGLMIVGLSN
jgi:hypothetical protein